MKIEEIPCILTNESKIRLVNFLLCEFTEIELTENTFSHFYICIYIKAILIRRFNIDLYDLIDTINKNVDHVVEESEGGSGYDNTSTEVLLRLTLPELLRFKPRIFSHNGGFWDPADIGPRKEALEEILKELKR